MAFGDFAVSRADDSSFSCVLWNVLDAGPDSFAPTYRKSGKPPANTVKG